MQAELPEPDAISGSPHPDRAVRRGVFKSVKDLNGKLRAHIEGWNKRAHPLVWTKTADEILKKANRSTTSNPCH